MDIDISKLQLNSGIEYRKCKDYGKMFKISAGERHFYLKHKLELPKRCENCRKAKKAKGVEIEDEL
jgi:hypothetical protein